VGYWRLVYSSGSATPSPSASYQGSPGGMITRLAPPPAARPAESHRAFRKMNPAEFQFPLRLMAPPRFDPLGSGGSRSTVSKNQKPVWPLVQA
jgi:hypothetical protein